MILNINTNYLLNFGKLEGKTSVLLDLCVRTAVNNKDTLHTFCTPFDVAAVRHQAINKLLEQNQIKSISSNYIELNNNSRIRFLKTNKPDYMRGCHNDYLYFDNLDKTPEVFVNTALPSIRNSDYKYIACTINQKVKKIKNYTDIFNNSNSNYDVIIKPVTPKATTKTGNNVLITEIKNLCVDFKSEITLGLNYGFFK